MERQRVITDIEIGALLCDEFRGTLDDEGRRQLGKLVSERRDWQKEIGGNKSVLVTHGQVRGAIDRNSGRSGR